MDEKQLNFIIKEGEGQLIEFKGSFTKSLAKKIVAFSNANGGRIFLGIDDGGVKKEIRITNKLKSQIHNIAKNLDPPTAVNLEEYSNILIIHVDEGENKPYSCKDGFFLRIGANSQKLSRDEIFQFAITEGKISFDEQINNEFEYSKDFDKNKLDEYLKETKLPKNLDIESILLNLGVAKKNKSTLKFNNAGVLFFAKCPG